MQRRKLVYLALIAPLHHLGMVIATVPAALLLPPDILAQAVLALPLFCVFLLWSVPALRRKLELVPPTAKQSRFAWLSVLLALANLGIIIAGVAYGILTAMEATMLYALIIIFGHAAFIFRLP